MRLEGDPQEHKERWPTTTSVALRLGYVPPHQNRFPDLVLATRRKTGKKGLIAGGVEKGEDHLQALYREAMEEAALSINAFRIEPLQPQVIVVPNEKSTSVGIIFNAMMTEAMEEEGYDPGGPEISFVKPYGVESLLELIRDEDMWYRPEFNLTIARQWLREYVDWKYGWEGDNYANRIKEAWGLVE